MRPIWSTSSEVSRERASPSSNPKKRKSSNEEDTVAKGAAAQHPAKNAADIMAEKKYRKTLCDKIAESRDSIPSLRGMGHTGSGGEESTEDLDIITSAYKLNVGTILSKAAVISKATEYICNLEEDNKYLEGEGSITISKAAGRRCPDVEVESHVQT